MSEEKVWHQYGVPNDEIRGWGEWYAPPNGKPWGLFGFTAIACAMTNCTTRYGIAPAHGDGIGTIGDILAGKTPYTIHFG